MLARRDRLAQLSSQPAQEAHLRGFHELSAAVPEEDARGAGPTRHVRTER
jgi:hypothetical protein